MFREVVKERLSHCKSDANDLLTTVHSLGAELDRELTNVMTKIAVYECELPEKLTKLKELKEELRSLKSSLLQREREQSSQREAVLELIQDFPDSDLLKNLAKHQDELNKLKLIHKLSNKIAACLEFIEEESEEACLIFDEILEEEPQIETTNLDEATTLKQQIENLASKIEKFSLNRIEKLLDSLGFPFDSSVDWPTGSVKTCQTYAKTAVLSADRLGKESGIERLFNFVFLRLEKRFSFHFYSNRKTNDPLHPEWYFQQLLQWIIYSLPFVSNLFSELTSTKFPAAEEFVKRVSEMANNKTTELLESQIVSNDPELFSHLIDEAISFEKIRSTYDTKRKTLSALKPFCEEHIIQRWTNIEQSVCSAHLDEILHGETKFEARFSNELDFLDEYRVAECADAFVSLLIDLGQRAQMLPEDEATKRITSVIVLLVDEFRARLAQIARAIDTPLAGVFFRVMNSIWYLTCVFEEWSDTLSFTDHLTPLKESAKMYRFMWIQMCDELVQHLRTSFALQLIEYKRQNWLISRTTDGISEHFWPALHDLRTNLALCSKLLSPSSFFRFFVELVKEIVRTIETDVLFCNKYSQAGAQLMLCDINDYLFPVFRSIASRVKEDNGEACNVLDPICSWEESIQQLVENLRFLALPAAQLRELNHLHETVPDDVFEEHLKKLAFNTLLPRRIEALIVMLEVTEEEFQRRFISSGEKDRAKELLKELLENSGWVDEIRELCREYLQKNGTDVSVEEMYNDLKSVARKAVTDEVKRKLFDLIQTFVMRYAL